MALTRRRAASTTWICVVLAAAFCGCSTDQGNQRTGFLTTYSNLEPASPTMMRYVSPDNRLANYSKFIVEPVAVRLYEWEAAETTDTENMQHVRQYMYEAVRKAMGQRHPIVADPGPGVARLRIAITNLKKSSPALNMVPKERLAALELGKASVELEIVDSFTGDQIAAAIDAEAGVRFSFSGLSNWGEVESVLDEWAARLSKRIDEAKGRSTADAPR